MNEGSTALLTAALSRVLRPLVRLMIQRGLGYPAAATLLRRLFVEVAEEAFALPGRRITDSRLSLLTGVQRREVKALRDGADSAQTPAVHGPLPRLLARWRSDPAWQEGAGGPRRLDRAAFEALVAEVSRDMHPRTLLDELTRQGVVQRDGDLITLAAEDGAPRGDEAATLVYFGANLGDHGMAAVANLSSGAERPPFFERAVHYNRLSEASLDALEALARERQSAVLAELNARALALQTADGGAPGAVHRFRVGAFVYRSDKPSEETS
ncbi:MAG: DUF6502 family protein [Pseudomonadota bacterium]